ncbi:MAG TPA: PHB depolymerase family esterase [Xanthomonadales bacterium]|nr:PHB depolymerase family esterase [Xanthomonadales bacterium]
MRLNWIFTWLFFQLLMAAATPPLLAGTPALIEVTDFGENPGNLGMQVYLPAGLEENDPLVVVAHGCFQSVEVVFEHSGWVDMANRYGFALLFPQTNKENEPFGACFRTWYEEHQVRGAGEPWSIRNQIAWMLETHHLDPDRVYMTGQSSGGLVTAVMLASYPELFSAGAIQSAYPYRCANTFEELGPCSQAQKQLDIEEIADLLLEAAPGYTGPRPPVALWHGAGDTLIVPANLDLQLKQWAVALGAVTEKGAEDRIDGQRRVRYPDSEDTVVIETVLVEGMDHAIAIDPDGVRGCGSEAPYIVDVDICAAYWIGRWFGVIPEKD